ncbi:MAG: DNA-binding NtrC family response regulator [Alteromonadaceae bacterium]|jgi:DNA-binding NtrC family response regulator
MENIAKKHILIVEDDANIASLYNEFLSDSYKTTVCEDGAQALAFFETSENRIDLVITDQSMPAMNGKELSIALLLQKPDLPIIMVTGYNNDISAENASDIGLKYFHSKPVSLFKLADTIDLCLYS